MNDFYAYYNGQYCKAREIAFSPWDLGLLRGLGVFDVLPVVNGKAFLWEWHFERLSRSAESLGLVLPVTLEEFGQILSTLIEKNEQESGVCFRTLLTGGVSEDAFTPHTAGETLVVLMEVCHELPASVFQEGARVMTLDHVRSFPRVKMTHYVNAIKTLPLRKQQGALETLYVQNKEVSECAQSNFFIVKDGVVITTNENALLGITQKLLLEVLAPELGIKTEVRKILFDEVLAADEAFLTGSNKGVVPVVRVDEHQVGNGKPGSITRRLIEHYQEYLLKS